MNDWLKAFVNAFLGIFTLVLVALLWHHSSVLIITLIALSVALFFIKPNRTSFVLYTVAFFFGPLAESIAISADTWTYAQPKLLGFPLWLPFVWGNCGLFLKNTAELSHILFKKLPDKP